jgi:lipoprotein-anchoring transpeptidase ErfK/SrfK
VNPKRKQTRLRPARLAIAVLAALTAAGGDAGATDRRSERTIESRTAGEPIMAIVSLRNQRITVYDANGWILQAPVSSGQRGRETPAGVFSVIQKQAEHYSNLYDDAYMPNMQRITWLRPDALRLRRTPVRRDPAGLAGDRGTNRCGAR